MLCIDRQYDYFFKDKKSIIITGNIFINKMKRQYSFNEISQITMGQLECENKSPSQPYYTASKQSRDSWTDMRVEEIKRKYDTPSHRKNTSNYGANDRPRQSLAQVQPNNPYTSYRNVLRDSIASNAGKRDQYPPPPPANQVPTFKEPSIEKSSWQENEPLPRFSYDSKQNCNFMQKFTNIKNSMKVQSKPPAKQNSKYRQYPSSKIDPRVQNIDKINMKIKKILDCLHENENYTRGDQRSELKSSFMKNSITSKGNHSQQLQQTQILSRQKISFDKQSSHLNMKSSNMNNQRFSLSPQVRTDSNTKWKLQQKYNYIKNSQSFLNDSANCKNSIKEQDQSDSWFEPNRNRDSRNRARSCLGNFKNQDIKLNSGKKLDDEISKINVRIREFQQQKKRLNIQFKPYSYEMKYNKSTSNLAEHKSQRGTKPPMIPKPVAKASEILSSFNHRPMKSDISEKVKTQSNQYPQRYTMDTKKSVNSSFDYKPLNRVNSSSFRFEAMESLNLEQKRQKTRTPQFEQKTSDKSSQRPERPNVEQQPNCNLQLKQKTEQGIEQRKRKLLQTATVTFSRQTKRLITNLFQQVKLDEDLRNAKIWYRDLFESQKWQQLTKQAHKFGVQISKSQIQVTQQQDNPFYSVRQSEQNYKCLIDRWIKAEKYWRENILGQFDLRQFEVERFTQQKVDLDRKGYFAVEDLVRFLNMETGTFYRNRDLILVFRRLTRADKLHWQQFLSKLDQQQ